MTQNVREKFKSSTDREPRMASKLGSSKRRSNTDNAYSVEGDVLCANSTSSRARTVEVPSPCTPSGFTSIVDTTMFAIAISIARATTALTVDHSRSMQNMLSANDAANVV